MRLEHVRKTPHDHVRDDERDRERQVQQSQNGRVGRAEREEVRRQQDGEEPGEAERGAHDPRYELGIHVEPSVLLRTSPLGAARAFHLLRMHIASSRFHDVVPSEKQYTVKRAGKGKLFI